MAQPKLVVRIPVDMLAEIDNQAGEWYMNRSRTVTRILQEWRDIRESGFLPGRRYPKTERTRMEVYVPGELLGEIDAAKDNLYLDSRNITFIRIYEEWKAKTGKARNGQKPAPIAA